MPDPITLIAVLGGLYVAGAAIALWAACVLAKGTDAELDELGPRAEVVPLGRPARVRVIDAA
jgi:hypothetical protein